MESIQWIGTVPLGERLGKYKGLLASTDENERFTHLAHPLQIGVSNGSPTKQL